MPKPGKSAASKTGSGKEGTLMPFSKMLPKGSNEGKSGASPTKVGLFKSGKTGK